MVAACKDIKDVAKEASDRQEVGHDMFVEATLTTEYREQHVS